MGGVFQANDGFSGRGLPATGFSDDTQALTPINIDIDAIQGFDRIHLSSQHAAHNGVMFFKIL
jgi:hypothetical protein